MAGVASLSAALGGAAGSALAGAREHALAGGCAGTALYRGAVPAWTAPAMQGGGGRLSTPLPHALSRRRNVTALVFGYPLRAGNPGSGRQNKILWIMRLPRRHTPLYLSARPLHANHPVVRQTWPADSSPGQIYPSIVDVPRAGCWRITLHWAGHTDAIALRYS